MNREPSNHGALEQKEAEIEKMLAIIERIMLAFKDSADVYIAEFEPSVQEVCETAIFVEGMDRDSKINERWTRKNLAMALELMDIIKTFNGGLGDACDKLHLDRHKFLTCIGQLIVMNNEEIMNDDRCLQGIKILMRNLTN